MLANADKPYDDARIALLAAQGINCLRSFRTRGIRIWGARTLAGPMHPFAAVSVRRVFLMCVRWLERFGAAIAFEPSDIRLWTRVHREVGSFLDALHRRGALVGTEAAEAFFIKCDAQNNPDSVRQSGRVEVDIGLAIAQPTEFIVMRLIAGESGTSIVEAP